MYTWRKAKRIRKRQTLFSSERKLHNDYYHESSVEKKYSLVATLKGVDAKTKWLAVNRQS
jgi:hypothetical protein